MATVWAPTRWKVFPWHATEPHAAPTAGRSHKKGRSDMEIQIRPGNLAAAAVGVRPVGKEAPGRCASKSSIAITSPRRPHITARLRRRNHVRQQ